MIISHLEVCDAFSGTAKNQSSEPKKGVEYTYLSLLWIDISQIHL